VAKETWRISQSTKISRSSSAMKTTTSNKTIKATIVLN